MICAAFLDRDGTIIADKDYLGDPAGVVLLPGAAEGLRLLQSSGYKLLVVTNQSGVARGYYSLDDMNACNERMSALLEAEDVRLDGVYACPHGPEAGCACRKPQPGLPLQAAAEHGVSLPHSVTIGDKPRDVQAGQAAGCGMNILVSDAGDPPWRPAVPNLEAAAQHVLANPVP